MVIQRRYNVDSSVTSCLKVSHCLTKNLTLSHSLNALYVNHFLPVQQGHNVAYLPSPKRQEVDTMRSQRQISREATRGYPPRRRRCLAQGCSKGNAPGNGIESSLK